MSRLLRSSIRPLFTLLFAAVAGPGFSQSAMAPGEGVRIRPAQSQLDEESFQTRLVCRALKALGYTIEPVARSAYAEAHRRVARGEATFMADHWDPLHTSFYEAAGGHRLLLKTGPLTRDAVQGYLIDRKTAEALGIRNLAQLRDPMLARHFDMDGDGKADLVGCEPGWGCRDIIDHQLGAYQLSDTVTHHTGPYNTLMARLIERQRQGLPVLYYTWSPNWVSDVLVPGRDVTWLTVPFSSAPGQTSPTRTALGDGTDYGFELNSIRIVVNRAFASAHPDALRLLERLRLPARDISAQNLRRHRGESSDEDIERHVTEWIDQHRVTWENWLREARQSAR